MHAPSRFVVCTRRTRSAGERRLSRALWRQRACAGAFRRSELCALEVADLTEVPDGLRVLIRRSKGDQEGQGQEVAIPRGYKLRPVEAVQMWLAAAEISSGPVFRAVALGGKVSDVALADDSAARIAQRGQPATSRWTRCAATSAGSICSRNTPGQRSSDGEYARHRDADNARWCITVARVGRLRRLYGVTLRQHHGHHIQRTDAAEICRRIARRRYLDGTSEGPCCAQLSRHCNYARSGSDHHKGDRSVCDHRD